MGDTESAGAFLGVTVGFFKYLTRELVPNPIQKASVSLGSY